MADNPLQELANESGEETVEGMQYSPIEIEAESPEEEVLKSKEIVSTLMGDFSFREGWRKPYEQLWDQIYQLYIGCSTNSNMKTRNKINIPRVFDGVEKATSKMVSFVTGSDNLFNVDARNRKAQPIADNIKTLLKDQIAKAEFNSKYQDFIKQLLMYGTSYLFCDWVITRDWIMTRTPLRAPDFTNPLTGEVIKGKLTWKTEKRWDYIENRPDVKVLDIADVFPHPNYSTVKESPGIFIRQWMDIEDFKKMGDGEYPIYTNVDVACKLGNSDEDDTVRQQRRADRGEQSVPRKNQVELIHFWGRYDLDGDGKVEQVVITIANRQVLVRAIANPYEHQQVPLLKVNFIKIPLEWYGFGIVEPAIPLQYMLNTVHRQRQDNVNQLINSMWKVLQDDDVDITQLQTRANGVILVPKTDSVTRVEAGDVTASSYKDAEILEQEIDRIMVPASLSGMDSGALAATVGGARIAVSQALEKFAVAALMVESDGLKPMLELFYAMDLQFLDEDKIIQAIYGYLFDVPITPEMIHLGLQNVQFSMSVMSELVGKAEKIGQLIQFYNVAKLDLAPQSKETILKQIYETSGFDPDDIQIAQIPPVPSALGAPGLETLPDIGSLPVPAPEVPVPTGPATDVSPEGAITTPSNVPVQ